MASYCTMENVQDYTLTGRKLNQAVYALIVISNVHEASGKEPGCTYVVDKVSIIEQPDDINAIRMLLKKMATVAITSECQGKPNSTPDWRNDETPCSAKKARRLGHSPTDDAMPSPARTTQ